MRNYLVGVYWFMGIALPIAAFYLICLAMVWKPKAYVKKKKSRRYKKKKPTQAAEA